MTRLIVVSIAALTLTLAACPEPPGEDAGPDEDGGVASDAGAGDAGGDAGPQTDAGPDSEPDTITPGETVAGSIFEPADQDVFHVDSVGGTPYRARLTLPAGSQLSGHLTAFDDGRDGAITGDDYAQLSITGGMPGVVEVEFLAMRPGHYIAVRDARNVGGAADEGSPAHTYSLSLEQLTLDDVVKQDVTFPETLTGTLAHAGAMDVFRFSTAETFEDVVFDLSTSSTDMDARLFVVAESTGDWIARNDNRVGSSAPLIDAPMTESGTLYLVVDNVELEATDLAYSIEATKP